MKSRMLWDPDSYESRSNPMPRNLKARESYHQDAAHLLKLADVINGDGSIPADKKHPVCKRLADLAAELAALKPYGPPTTKGSSHAATTR